MPAYVQTLMYTDMQMRLHTCAHKHPCVHTHTYNTLVHAHARRHTHTHTHTHLEQPDISTQSGDVRMCRVKDERHGCCCVCLAPLTVNTLAPSARATRAQAVRRHRGYTSRASILGISVRHLVTRFTCFQSIFTVMSVMHRQ